jgi:hypothetical protein
MNCPWPLDGLTTPYRGVYDVSSIDLPPNNGTRFRIESLERRMARTEEKLDAVKTDVLAERLKNLEERLDFLIKLLGGIFVSLVILIVTIALATGGVSGG